MKKLKLILLIIFCIATSIHAQEKATKDETVKFIPSSIANAQIITKNSTAEECRAFIENTAKSILGKDRSGEDNFGTTSVLFTGSEFQTIKSTKYFSRYETDYIPDWRDFKEFKSEIGDNSIKITFYFNKKNIVNESYILRNDKYVQHYDKFLFEIFIFEIDKNQEDKLSDLGRAGNRLKELAIVQKNNLFSNNNSLMLERKPVKEIPGKPSYKETKEYIEKYVDNLSSNNFFCNTVTFTKRKFKVHEDKEGNLILLSEYLYSGHRRPDQNFDFIINLSNTEEIKIVRREGFEGGCQQFGLWFVEKGKSATPVMHLPLWNGAFSDNDDNYKTKEIYKAFEHLRKMADAPEPLKF